jgi:hypothetical protein
VTNKFQQELRAAVVAYGFQSQQYARMETGIKSVNKAEQHLESLIARAVDVKALELASNEMNSRAKQKWLEDFHPEEDWSDYTPQYWTDLVEKDNE